MNAQPATSNLHKFANRNANNFNVLRFMAASFVVVSHGFELPTGLKEHDWVFSLTGRALSWYAVNLFFVISGYLIFASWKRNPSARSFVWARFLRLIPGLFVMLLITVPILGVGFSTLSLGQYFADRQTLSYFLGCLSIVYVKYELPGVFSANPLDAVNGSLWTLRYEIFCYFSILLAGIAGLLREPVRRRILLGASIALALVTLLGFDFYGLGRADDKFGMVHELARLALCFQLGALYSEVEGKLPLNFAAVACLVGAMILLAHTPAFATVAVVTTAYVAMWFAFVPTWKWLVWARTAPDYSYGIYIYAFPIQQAVISLINGISPSHLVTLAYPIILLLAAFSWHLVEKPTLSLKRLSLKFDRARVTDKFA